jgi:hypothetical protein
MGEDQTISQARHDGFHQANNRVFGSIAYFPGGRVELLVISVFCLGVALTFAASTVFHTFSAHSPDVCRACHALDWAMVACMIGVSDLLTLWGNLYCFGLPKTLGAASLVPLTWYMFRTNYEHTSSWYHPPGDDGKGKCPKKGSRLRGLVCMAFGSVPIASWLFHVAAVGLTESATATMRPLLGIYACYSSVSFNLFSLPERFFRDKNFFVVSALKHFSLRPRGVLSTDGWGNALAGVWAWDFSRVLRHGRLSDLEGVLRPAGLEIRSRLRRVPLIKLSAWCGCLDVIQGQAPRHDLCFDRQAAVREAGYYASLQNWPPDDQSIVVEASRKPCQR